MRGCRCSVALVCFLWLVLYILTVHLDLKALGAEVLRGPPSCLLCRTGADSLVPALKLLDFAQKRKGVGDLLDGLTDEFVGSSAVASRT